MAAAEDDPVLIAYDGSDESRAAVDEAARLLPGRRAFVTTIWERALATMALTAAPDPLGGMPVTPDPETAGRLNELMREQAERAAAEGAERARGAGLEAESVAVPGERDIPQTLVHVAEERGAHAIVVGSRGLGAVRSRLLGSTSQGVLGRWPGPVVVVRAPRP